MEKDINYAQKVFQSLPDKRLLDQSLNTKRILEYTIAKDAGESALKELSERWKKDDQQRLLETEKFKKNYSIFGKAVAVIIVIISIVAIILGIWMGNIDNQIRRQNAIEQQWWSR